MKAQILLVEDDASLAGSLADYLQEVEFEVDFAYNGESCLNLIKTNNYDLVIMDIGLPKLNGIDACQQIREEQIQTPVLFLTARDALSDKLSAFQAGADDYLQKPFSVEELVYRIQAILRRKTRQLHEQKIVGPLTLNYSLLQVSCEGQSFILPEIQFKILKILVQHAPNPVTRDQLRAQLWPAQAPESDPLRTHIYRLRQTLDQYYDSELVCSVYGKGYRLAV